MYKCTYEEIFVYTVNSFPKRTNCLSVKFKRLKLEHCLYLLLEQRITKSLFHFNFI